MENSKFVAFHRPSVGRLEIEEVVAALESGWLTTGPRTVRFEREFREYVQAPYSLAVNSCTAAMHLALAALGIGPGDEVITSPLTFCATVNCIIHVGATPVLADIGADGNIDPQSIADRVTDRTRAVMPVHFGGLPCDLNAIWEIARSKNLYVIEDAAHAVGAHYDGYPIGGGNPRLGYASDAVAFSFYATKNLTTGEGGMLTSTREAMMEKARVLCLHGISKDAWNRYTEKGSWFYEVVESGFKYNLTDIQSALGIAQLQQQEEFVKARTAYANFYTEQFAGLEELETPPDSPLSRHAWHLYPLRLNLDKLTISRAEFIEELRKKGIGASVHFIPIPKHGFFSRYASLPQNQCPRALELYPRLVSLPLYPAMSWAEVETVVAAVQSIAREHRAATVMPVASGAF
ncbi:MAG TPA: DegT/DnrJ/EryC1/StrS aminotransferase family protein [Bryobacteraceae bacterium]|nr:DegT/DnrJ/EryC1/StrS aminotransferase family protein [Bryobacteraceae bacterium]